MKALKFGTIEQMLEDSKDYMVIPFGTVIFGEKIERVYQYTIQDK